MFKDPIFHLSVAWCLGDQSSKLKSKLKLLELEIEIDTCRLLKVDQLICKTGNKKYIFNLIWQYTLLSIETNVLLSMNKYFYKLKLVYYLPLCFKKFVVSYFSSNYNF